MGFWLKILGRRARAICFAALLSLSPFLHTTAQAQDDEIVFGLIPALSPEVMVQRYQPLTEHLSKEIGVPIRLEGAPDYATYMTRVLSGSDYDLIITGGDFYRLAERRSGFRAIARVDGPGVQGLIIAAKGDNFGSLAGVPKELRIATIGELALMHRLGTQTLLENGISFDENATLVPTPSHNAAMLTVLSDRADIAIIAAPYFKRVDADIRDSIEILARTPLAPHHPIAVSPRMPEEIAERLSEALLCLRKTPEGLAALEAMSFPGFAAVEPDLYEVMDWAADDIERLLGLEGN